MCICIQVIELVGLVNMSGKLRYTREDTIFLKKTLVDNVIIFCIQ